MAKQSGLGDAVLVDDSAGTPRDLSTDITSYEIGNSQNLLDATSISKSAMERIIGLGDVTISLSGVFDAATNMAHDVFKTIASTTATRTTVLAISGQSLTNECFFTDYALSRASDGSLTYTSTGVLSNGTVPTWA